ncbi:hypothetical protein ES703_76836 [subsurface metagenome]
MPPHFNSVGLDDIELGVAENQVPFTEEFQDEDAFLLSRKLELDNTF